MSGLDLEHHNLGRHTDLGKGKGTGMADHRACLNTGSRAKER